jgi:hypothetical protein
MLYNLLMYNIDYNIDAIWMKLLMYLVYNIDYIHLLFNEYNK